MNNLISKSGLGIRPELFSYVLEQKPDIGFFEAHSENYFGGSLSRSKLIELRKHYPLSLHGVGLSLGRADELDRQHLQQLKNLIDEVEPILVSEHLAWSAYSHRFVPDLLPLPLNSQSLTIMAEHICQMQDVLQRRILLENPSNYLLFDQLQIPEPEFLNELANTTGCGLLVDVNNIAVSATNLNRSPVTYIEQLDSKHIGQYHLAGYTQVERSDETVLIDTHNHPVYPEVWSLFEKTINLHGVRPSLIEWDSDFPEFEILLGECNKAEQILNSVSAIGSSGNITAPRSRSIETNLELGELQNTFLDNTLALSNELPNIAEPFTNRSWVYQHNIFNALLDYLAELYPAVKGVVGEDYFKQMGITFIQKTQPHSGNIHLYGKELSDFLTGQQLLDDLPYLTDLVNYEWALHSAYYHSIQNLLDPYTQTEKSLLNAPVQFNGSVTLINSEYPLLEIHRQSLADYQGEVSINLETSNDNLLIYKTGYQVNSKSLSSSEYSFLTTVEKNENLMKAIEAVQGSLSKDDISTSLAMVFEHQLLSTKIGNS